jgi:hypothetical protein
MFVIKDVSQSGISTLYAGPHSATPVEQHLSPEGTAARHLSTAFFRAAELGKGSAALAAAEDTTSTRSNVSEEGITNDALERIRPVARNVEKRWSVPAAVLARPDAALPARS